MPALASLLSIALSTLAVSSGGAVAASHPLASEAGALVLRRGGNAVDAAVAAAFALSVVEPQSSGLGGGGFALVWVAREGQAYALDFREVAPAAATPDLFSRPGVSPRASLDGALAVAVPGAVKGYAELARRFGTRPLARLVEPAAALAERAESTAWAVPSCSFWTAKRSGASGRRARSAASTSSAWWPTTTTTGSAPASRARLTG